jgi:alpha-tubulin suppressor-like RCC1 family protein
VQIGALTTWSKISAGENTGFAIKTDGTLYAWGTNGGGFQGRLGFGDTIKRSSPTQVGSDTNWASVAANRNHNAATKTDGTLWTIGQNSYGELGNNGTSSTYVWNQVGALTNWLKVSAGNYFTTAVKTNGTLWAWGNDQSGQLAQGYTFNNTSPNQVGSLTTWIDVVAGNSHRFVLATKQ